MIKIINAKVHPEEDETLDELEKNIIINLTEYITKHKDFSYTIDKCKEENYVLVKTIRLEENAN